MTTFAQSDVMPLRELTNKAKKLGLMLAYEAGFITHAINVRTIEEWAEELKEVADEILELIEEE